MTAKRPARSRTVVKDRTVKIHLTIDDDAIDRYEIFLNGELVLGSSRHSKENTND